MKKEQLDAQRVQREARRRGMWLTPALPFGESRTSRHHREAGWLLWEVTRDGSLEERSDKWYSSLRAVEAALKVKEEEPG